jgi:hypothetical protein
VKLLPITSLLVLGSFVSACGLPDEQMVWGSLNTGLSL